jgi:hypothetical protein
MYTTKEAAATAGDLRYMSTKPCRRGHMSPRYTSSGNCIACVSEKSKQNKIKTKATRTIYNSKLFRDEELFATTCPVDWHNDLNRLVSIARSNDPIMQSAVRAALRGGAVAWNRDAFMAAGVIFNGQYITNASQFPVGHPFSIQIGGIWWPGAPLMACLRGEVSTITPCDFTPQVSE